MNHDDDQRPLFDKATMRPQFGGRQLQPGFEIPAAAEAMPLFEPAVDAERDAEAAMPTDQLMRNRGEAELFERPDDELDLTDPDDAYVYAGRHHLSYD
jgi:hypothetical protein